MEASAAPRRLPSSGVRRPVSLLRLAGDERLVDEVRRGSEPAFELLYDRHHRGILGFCRHMLGSLEEAEDAVQHTFMAAYRDLVGSDKPIQLKAWLYTIARNRCLSILRARREQPSDDIDSIATEGLASEVQRREDLRDMLRDVAGLPEDQRAALVLAEVGDVSHDEIAAILGCERAKVKALVFQARSSLTASRKARDTDCVEIREQLANLRGGSLRRTTLRRHLNECAGCRQFRAEMDSQRKALAILLPVVPALGLKHSVLAAAFGGGGSAAGGAIAAGGGTMAAAGGLGTWATKALVVAAVAGGGGAAGVAAVRSDQPATDRVRLERPGAPSPGMGDGGPAVAPAAAIAGIRGSEDDTRSKTAAERRKRHREAQATKRRKHKKHAKDRDATETAAGETNGNAGKGAQKGTAKKATGRRTTATRGRALSRPGKAKSKSRSSAPSVRRTPRRTAPVKRPAPAPKPDKPEPTPEPVATSTPSATPEAAATPAPDADELRPDRLKLDRAGR